MSVATVGLLIKILQQNYEEHEKVAYTIYSVGDILDHEEVKDQPHEDAVELWEEIVDKVGAYIEQVQSDINDYLGDEVENAL